MSEQTVHIKLGKADPVSSAILERDRRMQSCCTRTAYQFCKKNDIIMSANDMIRSDSAVQNLVNQRDNISETNYWLKQGAFRRAAWLLSANEELREEDNRKETKLTKQLEKLQKKVDKLKESLKKKRENIKVTGEKLSCAKTLKQKRTLQYRLDRQLSTLSKSADREKIYQIQKEIKKIKNKLDKIYERRKRNYTSIFGGRDKMIERCKNNITHEEFVSERLMSLYSVGDAEHGNRLFELTEESIIYKPRKGEVAVFPFKYLTKTQRKEIIRIIECVKKHEMAMTIAINEEYVSITCSTEKIYEEEISKYVPVSGTCRIMSIDVNPEGCGISICEWKSSGKYQILFTDFFDFSELFREWEKLNEEKVPSDDPRRKALHQKLDYETKHVAIYAAQKAEYYHVKHTVIENLVIESDDLGNRVANAKCNNLWKRNLFEQTLEKNCVRRGIRLVRVEPEYSSFEGNIIFRKHEAEPDMNMAALEIGRRGFELITQRIEHTRPVMKNIIFPETLLFKDSFDKSMEEFGLSDREFKGWKGLYVRITKSGTMYRRKPCDTTHPGLTRFHTKRSRVFHRPLVYKDNKPVFTPACNNSVQL